MLTFADLRRANLARNERWIPGKGVAGWSLTDWAVALAGEVGEACNMVKKLNRARDGMVGNRVPDADLVAGLAEELADVVTYADLLAARLGVDLGEAVARKFNAVSVRNGFPDRL